MLMALEKNLTKASYSGIFENKESKIDPKESAYWLGKDSL